MSLLFPLIFAIIAGALLMSIRNVVRETTLMGVWYWGGLACGLVAVAGCLEWGTEGVPIVRYLAGISTLLPFVALLGARRPQHVAWQFIVVSLWIVLGLPASHVWIRGGGQVSLDPLYGWFLWGLLAMELGNWFATRHALPVAMGVLAQTVFLMPQLPGLNRMAPPCAWWIGEVGLLIGLSLMAIVSIDARHRGARPLGWNQVWLEFRNLYGHLWAMRLRQRVNTTASLARWPMRLDWLGFHDVSSTDGNSPTIEPSDAEIRHCLLGMLRRFVDSGWLERHLPPSSRSTRGRVLR